MLSNSIYISLSNNDQRQEWKVVDTRSRDRWATGLCGHFSVNASPRGLSYLLQVMPQAAVTQRENIHCQAHHYQVALHTRVTSQTWRLSHGPDTHPGVAVFFARHGDSEMSGHFLDKYLTHRVGVVLRTQLQLQLPQHVMLAKVVFTCGAPVWCGTWSSAGRAQCSLFSFIAAKRLALWPMAVSRDRVREGWWWWWWQPANSSKMIILEWCDGIPRMPSGAHVTEREECALREG